MFKGILILAPEFIPIAVIVVVSVVPGLLDGNNVSIVVPINVNEVPICDNDNTVPDV